VESDIALEVFEFGMLLTRGLEIPPDGTTTEIMNIAYIALKGDTNQSTLHS